MEKGYAFFFDGAYYRVKNVDGVLKMMRDNPDFRRALIEVLKLMDTFERLSEGGYLEVSGNPGMREMAVNFAMLVKREFPREWRKPKSIGK